MTIAIIAIKGNHFHQQDIIFEAFQHEDLQRDIRYDSIDSAVTYLLDNYLAFSQQDISVWALWVDNDWTMIFDPEMVSLFEEETLLSLASILNTPIFTFTIQSNSNSFGFAKYSKSKERDFMAVDGNVTEYFGTPLPEEAGLNINENVFIDDITSLAKRLGIDIQGNKKQPYTVKQLGYNEVLKAKLAAFKQSKRKAKSSSAKPWWKLW